MVTTPLLSSHCVVTVRGQNTLYGYEGYFEQILAKIAHSSFHHKTRSIFTCGGYFAKSPG